MDSELKESFWGTWVAQSVKHLPLAQVMIPGSWDPALHQAPLLLPLLLPLPFLPTHVSSLSFMLSLKEIKSL